VIRGQIFNSMFYAGRSVDGAPSPRRAGFGRALPAQRTRDQNAVFESWDE
jgi:hypothetical protein